VPKPEYCVEIYILIERRPRMRPRSPVEVYQDFVTGFATDGKAWGRPVGVAEAADGSLLVTDDGARVIWRVSYTGK
jgi:glucose/arabinose dehydrogenase